MRRFTGTAAFVTLLTVWGGTPLGILLALAFASEPQLPSQFLFYATIVWSIASVVLFGILLHHDDYFDKHGVESLMGLTCTLMVGIPAMAFSSLPMVGSPADLLQSLKSGGNRVSLSDLKADTSRTLYLVGFDVSKSFIRDSADPRLNETFSAFDSFFYPNPLTPDSFAASLGNEDGLHIYVFANGSRSVLTVNDALERRQQLREIRSRVNGSLSGDLDRGTTDVVGFLTDYVCGEIEKFGKSFDYVKVIIISDWIQSQPKEGREAYLQDQRIRLKVFQECAKPANVAFLEFRAPAHENNEPQTEDAEADIGRQLRYSFGEERWQQLDLAVYNGARSEEKPTLPTLAYSNHHPSGSVYLKYLPDPGWKPFTSQIDLPATEGLEKLFVSFRPLTPDASPVRVYLKPGNGEEVVIDMNEKDRAAQFSTESGPLQLRLAQRTPGSRDARIEMLLAAPRASTIYRIPIVVLPVLREDSLWVLKSVVFAMHLLPGVLAVRIYRSRAKRIREKAGPPAAE